MPEGREMNAMEGRRMQYEGLRKDLEATENEWSGVFKILQEGPEGVGASKEIDVLSHKEQALIEAVDAIKNSLKEEHRVGLEEWHRLEEQEKMLLDEIVTNAPRYTKEEYKVVLDQINGVHERKMALSDQVDASFETLINEAA